MDHLNETDDSFEEEVHNLATQIREMARSMELELDRQNQELDRMSSSPSRISEKVEKSSHRCGRIASDQKRACSIL